MNAEKLAIHGGPPAVTVPWTPDWPVIGTEEIAAVTDLMTRGILSIYDRSGIIGEFEDAFATYHSTDGVAPLALSHSSGTSALHAAYFGLELRPGDEVIVPTYTFLATVTPLLQCGVIPVFADMDARTLTIDPASVAARISAKTRAIVATHMWGHPCAMPEILALARSHGLSVVEDCSHAHGATLDGQKVGTFGDAACFSLEGHKPMVAGEGGVMLTRSRTVYERALLLGHFGRRAKDEVADVRLRPFVETGFGHKYRIHPLAAAIALHQLSRLDNIIAKRAHNLRHLTKLLAQVPGVDPPETSPGSTRGGWYGFKARYVQEDLGGLALPRYLEALRAEGVRIKRPGSPPLHNLPVFGLTRPEADRLALPWAATLGATNPAAQECPVADAVYPTLLSLPTFSGDCDEVIEQYGAAFAKVARHWHQL